MFATAARTGTRRCLATRGLGRFSRSRLVEACKSNRPTAVLPFSHSFTCLPHRLVVLRRSCCVHVQNFLCSVIGVRGSFRTFGCECCVSQCRGTEKPLTLGEKLRIIEEAEKRNGATKASIARDLNIPESSLKTILAKKDSILLNAAKFGLNRKAAKDGKYAAMEKALVEWLRQARSSGIAVDGAILKEKAETVALRCGIDDFKASNGWLDRFKKRSGVVYSRCCGESAQLQPLDAGVIKCMKQKYRKFLVQRRLAGMERKQLDKKLSVLDAMHYIASAWDAVTPETIANSFRHCGFNRSGACSTSEAALPVDDEPEFGSLELPGSFADYVGADDDVAVCSEVSLDDIIETVRPDTAGTSDEEEMDDAAEASVSVPTYADVLCYVDHIRRFPLKDQVPLWCRTLL
ncbi:hypothetical protein HPB52_013695 [Rhipicephalus sanguineus]|uniref:HTH CENPB-type domain-containing protein n=1 Tax=Rhipicephalus sanguineus TaxID=34632 RepID=A0A9D4Q7I0_RHISA|nr:hypothetical protein HPB52_013695 [Rhipicephalus sanguineus]